MAGPAKGVPRGPSGVERAIRKIQALQAGEPVKAAAKVKKKNPGLAAAYGIDPNSADAFAGPMTLKQAFDAANAASNVKYGGALGTLNQQIKETPQWYQQYKDTVAGANAASQQYQQGLIDQSTNTAQQVGQSVLDTIQDKQAAESRKGLADLGTNLIRAIGAGNEKYFGGQAGVADASKIQTLTNLLGQKRQVQGEKGDYRTTVLNDLRTGATNADIARKTLNANVSNQQTDNAIQAAGLAQDASDKRKQRGVQRRGQDVSVQNTKTRVAAQEQARIEKDAAKVTADAEKKKTSIAKATHNIRTRVHDAQSDWERYARMRNPVTDANGKPTGATTKPTPDQVRAQLRKDGYTPTEIEVMLRLRVGKKLTPAEIHALHDQDSNIRIPKNWLQRKSGKPKGGRVTPLAPGANGQQRPT